MSPFLLVQLFMEVNRSNVKRAFRSVLFILPILGTALEGPMPMNASTCHDPRNWIEVREGRVYIVPANIETPDGEKITDSRSALAYLQRYRALLDPACIEAALDRVVLERYKPAIPTLFQYLDFLPPRNYPLTAHIGPTAGEYPGVEALAKYEKEDIIPDTEKTIRNDDANTLSRINAAKLYFFNYPDPETIRFIVSAAHAAVEPASSKALLEFAGQAAKHCPISKRGDCKRALDTQ